MQEVGVYKVQGSRVGGQALQDALYEVFAQEAQEVVGEAQVVQDVGQIPQDAQGSQHIPLPGVEGLDQDRPRKGVSFAVEGVDEDNESVAPSSDSSFREVARLVYNVNPASVPSAV